MAAGDTFEPIRPTDQLIFDAAGNLSGIRNPRANGADLRAPINYSAANRGIKVATLGDSRLAKSWGTGAVKYGVGVVYWTELLTRSRCRFPASLNFAVSGYMTSDALPKSALCAASDADFVLFWCDINDNIQRQNLAAGAPTVAQTKANIDTMIQQQLTAGKIVIVFASSPYGPANGTFTGTFLQTHMDVANYIRRTYQNVPGVRVVDMWDWYSDNSSKANSAAGYSDPAMLWDGTHPSPQGAYYAAQRVAAILDLYASAFDFLPGSMADIYSASSPYGALNPNPLMQGTTGTKGLGASGTVADNMTVLCSDAAMSAVCSIVTKNGRPYQQVVISGTPTTASPFVSIKQSDTSLSNITAGDTYEALAEIEVDSGTSNAYIPWLEARTQGTGLDLTQSGVLGISSHAEAVGPAFAYDGVIRCDPVTASAGFSASSTTVFIYCVQNAAAALTVRVGRLVKRKT